jgi:UDP-GlcNAc:undecaprenyl-phosphate GlcNAc-1-phosphate transferase
MLNLVPWYAPLLAGFGAAIVLTPLVRWLAVRTGDLDLPIGQKIHQRATPLMGGAAIYVAFAIATLTLVPLSPPVIGLLVGGLAAVAVGLLDEFLTLPPLVHLGGQVLAAFVAIFAGVGVVHTIGLPWMSLVAPGRSIPFAIGLVLTLFWLVGMMNTVNFLDGLDGLATGVAALAAFILAIWASEPQRFFLPTAGHPEDLLLPLAFGGALIGFLPYNWRRASIFIGDSGSMFVGLTLGALSIIGPAKLGTALLVLMIPVLDVAWAIVRRHLRGRSFLSGDKQHVYHRMLELGLGHTTTVLILYSLCLSIGVLDLLLVRMAKLVAFVVLAAIASAAFVVLERGANRRPGPDQNQSEPETPEVRQAR